MAKFTPEASDYTTIESKGASLTALKWETFQKFNISLLGLGAVGTATTAIEAITAVFDLEGFTTFCKQADSHLSVPLFLREFLEWLIDDIAMRSIGKEEVNAVSLCYELPFFLKFTGDGILVLWRVNPVDETSAMNLLYILTTILEDYRTLFLDSIKTRVIDPPPKLRCGVARGTVYSLGDGNDYVGSCINIAARLQKLPGVTFAFHVRGFNRIVQNDPEDIFEMDFCVVKTALRGIGENELIALLIKERESLTGSDKETYRGP